MENGRATTLRRHTLVLCYHAVSDDWPAPLAISAADLRRQVRALIDRGFAPARFSDALTRPNRGRTLAITFDDAFRSVFERALPVLDELGAPATLFVPTAHAGSGAPMSWPGIDGWRDTAHAAELAGATWEQIAALADAGWEIGSHSRSHPRLTTLADDELAAELGDSRAELERRLGRPCRSIAYPYGDVDARVAAAARAAGYELGGSLPDRLEGSPTAPDPMRWPRIGVYRGDGPGRVALKSLLVRRLPRTWAAAQTARRIARRR